MKYAYINGVVLDGREDMRPISGKAILTDGRQISDIIDAAAAPEGYTAVDLGGRYILPGLINLHVHLPASGKPKNKPTDAKKLARIMSSTSLTRTVLHRMCAGYARTELLSGVTTIRTVGGLLNCDSDIRDGINAGETVGPRILAANMAVSVPGGHMAGSLAYEARSAEEARQYVERIAADSPDLIKLMITGGVLDAKVKGEPGELKMPPEYVRAACGEAHARGLKVAAHVESPEGVRVALENGVDSIEHGAMPDEDILRLFRERGAALVTTLSPALPYAEFDRAISHASELEQFNGKVVFRGIIECAKACLAAGIPVGIGTDTGCPYITHYDMWRELIYFSRYCGVSPAFALYTATLGNARIAGIGAETGSIEKGKCADLIVCDKNPLEDLSALRRLFAVVARGNYIASPSVRKMPNVERELDKFL